MADGTQNTYENVLQGKFKLDNFIWLIKELMPDIDIQRRDLTSMGIKSNFRYFIEEYGRLAEYTSIEGEQVAVLVVRLNKGNTVERARSLQRNFVKEILDNNGIDAALVAFYCEENPKWRLSFLHIEREFAEGRLKEKLTSAKRLSYLVGKGEPCHTAKARLLPVFHAQNNPSVAMLEEAFSVEVVTKEFFQHYCEQYMRLKKWLEQDAEFKWQSEAHQFTSEQFAKKLMGQLVFLYFIQKKGWLGVNAIPKQITEKVYKNAKFDHGKKGRDIFPRIYTVQPDGSYYLNENFQHLSEEDEKFVARNIEGSAWGDGPKDFLRHLFNYAEKNHLNYFNDCLEYLFYEGLNKNRGDDGYYQKLHCRIPFLNGGLFEPLGNYEWQDSVINIPNEIFSTGADEPKDMGILDVFDIYNFTISEDEPMEKEVAIDPEMLGKIFESLLDTDERKAKGAFYTPREIVHYMCQESLIHYLVTETKLPEESIREFVLYGEIMKDSDIAKNTDSFLISSSIYDEKNGINRLGDIDTALDNLRVADPAVGSGAFLLGMLNEIVRMRENISAYQAMHKNKREKRDFYQYDRAPYTIKMDTIKKCLFAVDIEPSAVDIAKLRLWLSIVIEDEVNPNAEDDREGSTRPRPLPNLDCNILCGNSLIDEFEGIKLIQPSELYGKDGQGILANGRYEAILRKLFEAQDRLFRESDHNMKQELKRDIERCFNDVAKVSLEGATDEVKARYTATRKMPSKPYFLWELEFGRVFKEKGGFDIVIGNPPYLNVSDDIYKTLDIYREISKGVVNMAALFLNNALVKITHIDSVVSLIIPKSFYAVQSWGVIRKKVLQYKLLAVNDVGKAFENVGLEQGIVIVKKSENDIHADVQILRNTQIINKIQQKFFAENDIILTAATKEVFDLLMKIEKNTILLGDIADMPRGITVKSSKYSFEDNSGYIQVLGGTNIKRYKITDGNKRKPNRYLSKGEELLSQKISIFNQERIVYQNIMSSLPKVVAALEVRHLPTDDTVNNLIIHDERYSVWYILALLNSRITTFYLKYRLLNCAILTVHLDKPYIGKIPVKMISKADDMKLKKLIENMNDENIFELDLQIDKLLFEIYGLSQKEADIIDGV